MTVQIRPFNLPKEVRRLEAAAISHGHRGLAHLRWALRPLPTARELSEVSRRKREAAAWAWSQAAIREFRLAARHANQALDLIATERPLSSSGLTGSPTG